MTHTRNRAPFTQKDICDLSRIFTDVRRSFYDIESLVHQIYIRVERLESSGTPLGDDGGFLTEQFK